MFSDDRMCDTSLKDIEQLKKLFVDFFAECDVEPSTSVDLSLHVSILSILLVITRLRINA